MTCTCKTDLEAKLTERFKANAPEASDHSVTLQGYGFAIVGNSMKSMGYMDAKASANYPLKNGGSKQKTVTQNMFFSFCPFCGVKVGG